MRPFKEGLRRSGAGLALAVSLLATIAGCGVRDEPPPPAHAEKTPDEPEASLWRSIDDSAQLALPMERDDAALAAAIAEARRTAVEAQQRWQATPLPARRGWAIKWAAPLLAGGVEYVWVEPAVWTAHRIEGRLASPPQHELRCGKRLDDLVGFAAEEFVDWVHFPNGDFTAPGETREGGFTLAVLENRYGPARPAEAPASDEPSLPR